VIVFVGPGVRGAQEGLDSSDVADAARNRSGLRNCSAQRGNTGDAMAEMNEADILKLMELLQVIADAVQAIGEELSKFIPGGK
jgi:hypothetical protein